MNLFIINIRSRVRVAFGYSIISAVYTVFRIRGTTDGSMSLVLGSIFVFLLDFDGGFRFFLRRVLERLRLLFLSITPAV